MPIQNDNDKDWDANTECQYQNEGGIGILYSAASALTFNFVVVKEHSVGTGTFSFDFDRTIVEPGGAWCELQFIALTVHVWVSPAVGVSAAQHAVSLTPPVPVVEIVSLATSQCQIGSSQCQIGC